jgi:hypothetical protein
MLKQGSLVELITSILQFSRFELSRLEAVVRDSSKKHGGNAPRFKPLQGNG